jgi:hypothetical protein
MPSKALFANFANEIDNFQGNNPIKSKFSISSEFLFINLQNS